MDSKAAIIPPSLFPKGVITAETNPRLSFSELYDSEWQVIANAVPKRQAEFCGGRICAHRALDQLGVPRAPILPNKDRSPRWPKGVIGTIAHTRGVCAAAVAKTRNVIGLGLDIELDAPLESELMMHICSPREREWLLGLPDEDRGKLIKVLFCIKEAVFKCQYPLSSRFISYPNIEIALNVKTSDFSVLNLDMFTEKPIFKQTIMGRFAFGYGYVMAGASISIVKYPCNTLIKKCWFPQKKILSLDLNQPSGPFIHEANISCIAKK